MNRPDRDPSRLDEFLQAAPIGLAQVDLDGRILAANREFVRALGGDVDEAVPSTLGELAPSIEAASRDILASAAADSEPVRRTLTIGAASRERSIDLVGWSSTGSGGAPVAGLLVTEAPQNADSSELVQAVERARAARELHDGLAQDLWLAKLAAMGLDRNPSLDPDARALCADLLRAIEAALSEARTAVMAMRSVDAPTPLLSELITRHVNEFSDRFGIRAESHVEKAPPVPPRVALEILRVVQEALNNVRKHARPARAMVRVEERRNTLVVSVRDDGIGFDPTTDSSGYGRESMRERAQSIGGRLTIASAPGRGTSVTLRVPMAQFGRTR